MPFIRSRLFSFSSFYGAVCRAQDLGVPSVDPVTAAVSVVWTMDQAALAIPGITEGMMADLPGYAPGLGWLLPAVDWRAAWKDDSRRK